MKNKKQAIIDSLFEGFLELIFAIILFAIGYFVCLGISSIFSIDITDFDSDLFVLIGILFIVVIILAISLVKRLFNKDKKE